MKAWRLPTLGASRKAGSGHASRHEVSVSQLRRAFVCGGSGCCNGADPALGQPGRRADPRPAFAERGPDQFDERAGLRKACEARPSAQHCARSGQQLAAGVATALALQIARWREVPRRHAVDGGRRGFLGAARAAAHGQHRGLRHRFGPARGYRWPDGGVPPEQTQPDLSAEPGCGIHHEQGLVREAQGQQAAGLQEQGRELRRVQRQRHRALPAGEPPAWHQDGLQAQPGVVGRVGRQRAANRLHADCQRRHPAGSAGFWRD